jgi:hypothetical protein
MLTSVPFSDDNSNNVEGRTHPLRCECKSIFGILLQKRSSLDFLRSLMNFIICEAVANVTNPPMIMVSHFEVKCGAIVFCFWQPEPEERAIVCARYVRGSFVFEFENGGIVWFDFSTLISPQSPKAIFQHYAETKINKTLQAFQFFKMVVVYSEPIIRRYYAPRVSGAYCLTILVAVISILLPFFIA